VDVDVDASEDGSPSPPGVFPHTTCSLFDRVLVSSAGRSALVGVSGERDMVPCRRE
jgi:hypothetical protein